MRPWRVGAAVMVIAVVAAVCVIAQDGPQPPVPVEAVAAAPVPVPARPHHALWPRPAPALTPSPHEEDSEISEILRENAAPPAYEGMHPITTEPPPALEAGSGEHSTEASFYSTAEMGTTTASDTPLDDSAFTTAHRTLAMGTVLRVCYQGSCIRVTVTDRGPYVAGRDLDLSLAAFVALAGSTGPGVIRVTWSEV